MATQKKQVNANLLWYRAEQAAMAKLKTGAPPATGKEKAAMASSRTHHMIGRGLN